MAKQQENCFKLQQILFPVKEVCGDTEMYFKGTGFNIENNKIQLEKGGILSVSTYFNSFSLLKWKNYTGIDNLAIVLNINGSFELSLYSMCLREGKVIRTLISKNNLNACGDYSYNIPATNEDILFFELKALNDRCVFNGGYYVTNLAGRSINRVKLAIGICTFRREEFVTANLSRLTEAINNSDCNLHDGVKVFVSDNGQTLPLEQLEDSNIHIVYNKNLGGAGGFTRCLIEALHVQDKENFTNFLFLDDDIVLSVNAIERNIAFLSLLLPQYRKSVVGGAMFSTDERYLQFESAAKWQRTGFVFNRRDIDMRDNINILLNEQKYDVNYNAWCYCCIPFDVVTKNNLPLPIFFHMDDVEYGLRNNLPVITLNGINVWHLYKKALVNAKNDYYDVRNRLIMLSEINPGAVRELAYIYLNAFTKEALKYHYARSLNALDGILDFCKGFEWFKHLNTEKKHAQLINNVKWCSVDKDLQDVAIISLPDPISASNKKFKIRAAINQVLFANKKVRTVFNENSITDTFGVKGVRVYLPQENQSILYKRNLRLAVKCFVKHFKAKKAIIKKLPGTVKEFNHRITEIQASSFWLNYSNISYNLCGEGKKVLFVASDNDATSGAFRSMVTLCCILRDKFKLNICIVLPKEGDGLNLVKAARIRYTIIDSEDWIVRLNASNSDIRAKRQAIKKLNGKAIRQLSRFIKDEQFDLVHINTSYSYVGAIAANKAQVPTVWHIREFLEEDQQRKIINKKYGYKLMNKSSKLVAISQSILKKYSPIFDIRLVQIYNGIDDKQFYEPRKEILQSNKIIFICVGAITSYKGQMIAVEAVERLKRLDNFVDFELWLVGTDKGEYANSIRLFIQKSGLSENVKFLGRRQDVAELYQQSDIACVCSKAEAFGRITVEAMMSGNLVIGADTAGTKEIIEDGVDGLLFKSGDSDSLYNKIKFALDNKEEARKLAKHGRQTAIEKFTADRNAEEIYNLYQEIWKRK